MKTCPICQAKSFDDMELCYTCMHRFEMQGLHAEPANGKASSNDESCTASGMPKEFIRQIKPKVGYIPVKPEAVIPISGSGYSLVISLRPENLPAVS